MADTHVVSALKDQRVKLATHIESLQADLRQAVIDLDHVEATLKQFDPDVNLGELGPRRVPQVLTDVHGDTGRVILDTLRTATAPLRTTTVCEAIMKARGLDTNDKALCRLMMKRTVANLKHWSKKRGLVRSMPGAGQEFVWELVR
ncbi:MAG: hypothetical protein ISS15_17900 [Alphaproteobacteria bacterium]|nr:hypothetical protein [Alphaproteobacteria bacterium]MBL6938943.1 hypothetical protein [Alphaproteobacteria bacterium]MBL7099535.1 hypothetical protein [Alphaproteobacteria bacterium]